ncbi:putative oxidoreductase C terminal-domain-containing protein [Pterulicium gracile]|uniref:Putative oxidoreductase C terminal-domain-containing protein n=1 Tax=Pterulicium gracile TaxID=1884261 RepID=A0A5C3QA43_9AGAR|nr:putative oxidoreductase C terminal-domain-containing protein [Pterula gracilis]
MSTSPFSSRRPSERRGSERRGSELHGLERRDSGPSRRGSIDPLKLIRMDKTIHIGGHNDFNVVFIGAGNIMFGSPEGPWNHSFRFEHKLGPRLKVTALIDPAIERATSVLQKKCDSFVRSAYEDTRVYKSLDEFVKNMTPNQRPRAIVIGSPPMFRGTSQSGRDTERQIMKHFPGVPLFIEKPIATGPESEMQESFEIAKQLKESGTIHSVGYMLRYLKAVQQMKQIIIDNNLTVMATIARYACAYEAIAKPDWWTKSKSAGPIIEQGTHFCDLSRYFGGEVDISTVNAHSLEWDEAAGNLSKMVVDESQIEPHDRIPRVTSATWKYESGAVGSFTHLVALQGQNYACELEVWADGYQLKLVNPYVSPVLYIRQPGDDDEHVMRFPDDDPFFSEVSILIDQIEDIEDDPDAPQILSSFEDACKTYELTWAIRRASELSRLKKKEGASTPQA